MALIKCPECKKKVSDKCNNCPNCGYPIGNYIEEINTENNSEVINSLTKNKTSIYKKIWFWAIIGIFVVAIIVATILLINKDTKPRHDADGNPIFVEFTSEVYTNVDDYLGYYINITGKVFQVIGDNGSSKSIQIWIDPDTCEHNLMIYYNSDVELKQGDYIICSGYIDSVTKYKNAYDAELQVPLVYSSDLKKATYIDVMAPTIDSISPENLKQEQFGYSTVVDKVEFAESETRIYITITNNGKALLNVGDAVIVQDRKQYNSKDNYEADYEQLPYEIVSGASCSGIIVFPPLNSNDFEFFLDLHSGDVDDELNEVVFTISKNGSFIEETEKEETEIQEETATESEEVIVPLSEYEKAYVRKMSNYSLYIMFDEDVKKVVYFGTNDTSVMIGTYTGSFSRGVTISWDKGWDEKFKHSGGSKATLVDGNGFDWEYQVCDINEAQSILDTLDEKETQIKPEEPIVNRKEQAVTVAFNNITYDTTPNDIKFVLTENGFSSDEINYAVYGGHINWREYIPDYIYGLNHETEVITVTNCIRCHKSFYGEYNSCQYLNCGGGVNWNYYYGYSRAETISKLLAAGYLQSDIDAVMQEYEYGEFIDEIDFSDCIVVTGKLCDHFWNPPTCQELSTCPYCGETKGDYAEHEYSQHKCIYCDKEEPWTPPQIDCSEWVSLEELQEKAGYYIKTPGNTITIEDLNDNRVNFILTNFPTIAKSGEIYDLYYNDMVVQYQYVSGSDSAYEDMKLRYSDLVAIGILK